MSRVAAVRCLFLGIWLLLGVLTVASSTLGEDIRAGLGTSIPFDAGKTV
jgi:hypothetical protein